MFLCSSFDGKSFQSGIQSESGQDFGNALFHDCTLTVNGRGAKVRMPKPCKKALKYIQGLTEKYTMTIKTRLDPTLHEAAKQAAEQLGISLTEYLRRLVLADLEARNGGSLPGLPGGGGGGNIIR